MVKQGKKQMFTFENCLEEALSNRSYTFLQDLEENSVNNVKTIAYKNKQWLEFLLDLYPQNYLSMLKYL